MKEDMTVNKDVMVIQNSAGRTVLQESPAQSYPVGISDEGYVLGEVVRGTTQVVVESIHSIDNIINHLASIVQTEQIEETKRLYIREQSKRCLAFIESDLLKFQASLQASYKEREQLFSTLQALIMRPDLDDGTVSLVRFLLEYLVKNDPLRMYYNDRKEGY